MDNTSADINSNTILAYKLLSDAWGEKNNVFKSLMKNEMKYLVSGVSLLQNDPYLQMHFGQGLSGAEKVAQILRSKVNELNIRRRLEPTADVLLRHNFALNPSLMPGANDAVMALDDHGMAMKIKKFGLMETTPHSVTNQFSTYNLATGVQNSIDGIQGLQSKMIPSQQITSAEDSNNNTSSSNDNGTD